MKKLDRGKPYAIIHYKNEFLTICTTNVGPKKKKKNLGNESDNLGSFEAIGLLFLLLQLFAFRSSVLFSLLIYPLKDSAFA